MVGFENVWRHLPIGTPFARCPNLTKIGIVGCFRISSAYDESHPDGFSIFGLCGKNADPIEEGAAN